MLCAPVCVHTYTPIPVQHIHCIYVDIYRSVYTFIHNIVYTVTTGDTLNWVQTLAHVYLSPVSSVCFKQSGALFIFKVHF